MLNLVWGNPRYHGRRRPREPPRWGAAASGLPKHSGFPYF
jgi:hypothetical protein